MSVSGTFPFGEPLRPVVQLDRGPKDVFVLGVFSNAVHARWIGPDGKTRISWGAEAEVVKPRELRQEVARETAKMAGNRASTLT